MNTLGLVFSLIVAALHVFFFVLEAVLWTKPYGRKVFRTSEQHAKDTASLAANQGLYNLFLAAGLVWGIVVGHGVVASNPINTFFLVCVIVAGVFGALTVNRRILFIQAVPAALGLVFALLA